MTAKKYRPINNGDRERFAKMVAALRARILSRELFKEDRKP
jgi:hypothetical protein